jgi:hypothetical protein
MFNQDLSDRAMEVVLRFFWNKSLSFALKLINILSEINFNEKLQNLVTQSLELNDFAICKLAARVLFIIAQS